jgi:hypothetical protein
MKFATHLKKCSPHGDDRARDARTFMMEIVIEQ